MATGKNRYQAKIVQIGSMPKAEEEKQAGFAGGC